MKIAIDFFDTITADLNLFRTLVRGLDNGENQIYIITAVGAKKADYIAEIIAQTLPATEVVVIESDWQNTPALKYEACRTRGIELLIDDRIETCEYFCQRTIPAFLYKGRDRDKETAKEYYKDVTKDRG